ncbi:MAG: peptidase M54 [Deltaproteobacteria bacterium]|nr:peptidase M54 [Deltaproteobacteria bacterium]
MNRSLRVEIIPLGRVDEVAGAVVAANIQEFLGFPTTLASPQPVPEEAHLPGRNQYDAGWILKQLRRGLDPRALRLGVTTRDLALPILTYVFGEALVGGRAAVVSVFRLGTEPGQPRKDLGRLYERLAKVALHETAHALGVPHCRRSGCLMRFSYGLDHLDTLEIAFCPACREEIARRTGALTGINYAGTPEPTDSNPSPVPGRQRPS